MESGDTVVVGEVLQCDFHNAHKEDIEKLKVQIEEEVTEKLRSVCIKIVPTS